MRHRRSRQWNHDYCAAALVQRIHRDDNAWSSLVNLTAPSWLEVYPPDITTNQVHPARPSSHGSAIGSFTDCHSSTVAFTAASAFTASHAAMSACSRCNNVRRRASVTKLDRRAAGTVRTKEAARSSGMVNVIFRIAITPYYHILPKQLKVKARREAGLCVFAPKARFALRVGVRCASA